MPYTVLFTKVGSSANEAQLFSDLLTETLRCAGDFRANVSTPISTFEGMKRNSPMPRHKIEITRVRLKKAKPYCGNHPGPCVADGRKKPNTTFLEWGDWVAFHAIVNAILNIPVFEADVWSLPQDVAGKMWIRKNNQPRLRWDYEDQTPPGAFHPRRIWNVGTPDQFLPGED